MNNLILHKIVIYLKKKPSLAKLFFYIHDYRLLINTSNSHFDELYNLYGNKNWSKITNNLRSVQAMFRLKIPHRNNTTPMDYAIKNGHLKIIKWLYNEKSMTCNKNSFSTAVIHGHFKVIKWLYKNILSQESDEYLQNKEFTHSLFYDATENGHLHIAKWLNKKLNILNNSMSQMLIHEIIDEVIYNRQIHILKWFNRLNVFDNYNYIFNELDTLTDNANNLKFIKWLVKHVCCSVTVNIIDYAARYNQLKIIKWFHKHRIDCMCNRLALIKAAKYGHLKTLKYLHKNYKDKCNISVLDNAKDHPHIIKWLKKHCHCATKNRFYNTKYQLKF